MTESAERARYLFIVTNHDGRRMGRYKDSVRTLLKQRGVDPDLLAVRSAGTLDPREQENTEIARSINRRVSFTVGIDE